MFSVANGSFQDTCFAGVSPKRFTKKLARLFYRFIWGSNWERISRQKLCNGIEHGGAKMIDVEKYFLSLKAKWINTFLGDNFVSQWKIVESSVKTLILNCVISSNLNIEHVQIKKLILFRTLRNLINTMLKTYSYTCLCEPIQNKPSWLNKLVRLNKAVLYNEEFDNAGIVDYGHLINSAGEILDYDRVTKKFDISPNNSSFIEFTKLYAVYPVCWDDNKNYQLPDNHDHLSSFRSALITILRFPQNGLIIVCEFNIVEPIKQQELWSKDLNIQSVVDWDEIYKTNYSCTVETKLHSFQIKFNLRVVVTNI